MVPTMGVNSISSRTVDGRGLQEACKKQPQEERTDSEFRNFVTERGIARPEGPAAQQQGATAIERDPAQGYAARDLVGDYAGVP